MSALPATPRLGSLKPQPGRSNMIQRSPLRLWTRLTHLAPATKHNRRPLADLLHPDLNSKLLQVDPTLDRMQVERIPQPPFGGPILRLV